MAGNVFRALLLNYALFPLMGTVLGKMFALRMKKRWSGYLGILIIILLGYGIFYRINMGLYMTTGVNLDSVFRFFQFEQPNDTWVADDLYMLPVENYRFLLVAAWIVCCEAVLCRQYFKKKPVRMISTLACGVLCVSLVLQIWSTDSYVNYDLNSGAAGKAVEFEDDELPEEKAADFSVEECSMELHIADELEADVDLILGDRDSTDGTYCFSLYRGYVLTSVTDGAGTALAYDRESDYITVYAAEDISEIHMSYHGSSTTFYSNSQGVMLPGYFAWYPQPGFRQVYLNQIVDGFQYSGFNTGEEGLQETGYEICVDYDREVYSNLETNGEIFCGTTAVPTLVGGVAAEEDREDGHYIYPALTDVSGISLESIQASAEDYFEMLGLESDAYEALTNIIFVPSTVYLDDTWANCVSVGDCLFLGTQRTWGPDEPEDIALDLVMQYLNVRGEKEYLKDVVDSVLRGSQYLDDLIPMEEEEFFDISYTETESEEFVEFWMDNGFERMYLTLAEKFGDEEVLQSITRYLKDQEVTENGVEFMQELYLELEAE